MNRMLSLPLILAGTLLAAQAPGFPAPDGHVPPFPCGQAQAGPGGGQPGHGAPHRPAMEPGGPMADLRALALTPDQAKAVRSVLEQHHAAATARRRAVDRKEEALHAAAADPAVPEARLRALHAEAAEARLQDLLEQRAVAQELNALLTPEQQAKAARIRAGRQKEREARRALMEELGDPAPVPPPAQP